MPQYNHPLLPALSMQSAGISAAVGAAIVTGASANTKGSYQSIFTASSGLDELHLMVNSASSGQFLIDVEIGGVVRVGDFPMNFGVSLSGQCVRLPVKVGIGQAVRIRASSNVTSRQLWASVVTFSPQAVGYTQILPIGPVGSDVRNTGVAAVVGDNPTPGTWVSVGTLGAAIAGLFAFISNNNDTARISQQYAIDIGVGNAGSQTVLATFLGYSGAAAVTMDNIGPLFQPLAAGVQLWARATGATATTGGDTINVQLHGIS